MEPPTTVVSGGQAGVDRAALDAAIAAGVPYGGWCPAGGWAEDLPTPPGLLASYPLLRETATVSPAERTRLNVRDSDATLVVAPTTELTGGTLLTAGEATRLGRPLLVSTGDVREAAGWLRSLGRPLTLNVAGPRASGWPEGYAVARALLEELLARP